MNISLYEWKEVPNVSGIYCLYNTLNDKMYIGQSKHIPRRFTDHRCDLLKGVHSNAYLQNAWNKDKEYFKPGIIEECSIEQLNEKEEYYLSLCTKDKMYNILLKPGLLPNYKIRISETEFSTKVKEGQEKRKKLSSMSDSERIEYRNAKRLESLERSKDYGRRYTISDKVIKSREKYKKENISREYRENKPISKEYQLCFQNTTFTVRNLSLFCEENNLEQKRLRRVINGTRKTYKGYSLPPGEREKIWQPKPRKAAKEKIYSSEKSERIAKINAENSVRIKNGETIHPTFIDPNGNEHVTNNISQLAKQFNIPRNGLYQLKKGKFPTYYGWSIKKD